MDQTFSGPIKPDQQCAVRPGYSLPHYMGEASMALSMPGCSRPPPPPEKLVIKVATLVSGCSRSPRWLLVYAPRQKFPRYGRLSWGVWMIAMGLDSDFGTVGQSVPTTVARGPKSMAPPRINLAQQSFTGIGGIFGTIVG